MKLPFKFQYYRIPKLVFQTEMPRVHNIPHITDYVLHKILFLFFIFFAEYDVRDYGDLLFPELACDEPFQNVKNPRTVGQATEKVANVVSEVTRSGRVCLTLGGDHR